jgi:3-phosphoshikimate 1-carboxyvinyltransferase
MTEAPFASSYRVVPLDKPVQGQAIPPGSKSYTNRALVLAALARGKSTLEGALFSDDTRHMATALRELGFHVVADEQGKRFEVEGLGGRIPARRASLFVGNSGTTARFLVPLVALGEGVFDIDGNEAMQKRPIQPLLDAIAQLGGRAVSLRGNGCPPIRVEAHGLEGGRARMPGALSSQYFTALLLTAPSTRKGVTLEVEGDLVSKPYIEVTEQAMNAFGARIVKDEFRRFEVAPGEYGATSYAVEPDASAASYFFAAAAVTGGTIAVRGLGSGSLQGDLQFVRVLEKMGCRVRQTISETEVVGPQKLRGVEVDMSNLSDTAQTLGAIAPLASTPTRVTGIGFIRRKETDRVAAVVSELKRLGISAEEESDGFVVYPGTPKPAAIETYDDHRMAMSFAILGLATPGIEILNPGCVAKTFPDFFRALEALRRA